MAIHETSSLPFAYQLHTSPSLLFALFVSQVSATGVSIHLVLPASVNGAADYGLGVSVPAGHKDPIHIAYARQGFPKQFKLRLVSARHGKEELAEVADLLTEFLTNSIYKNGLTRVMDNPEFISQREKISSWVGRYLAPSRQAG